MDAGRLDILYAAEHLLPATGGAERCALDWLEALAPRHSVRAAWLEGAADAPAPGEAPERVPAGVEAVPVPAPRTAGGYWRGKRERREALGAAVAGALTRRPAGVVMTALHAAPAVVAAARAAGSASVLVLHSYESLCKFAFDAGSACRPESGCRECPRARELDAPERAELHAARAAHERALAQADALVAPSRAVARACRDWCGREPALVPEVAAAGPPLAQSEDGPILLAAARWAPNKGLDLLLPLARALAPRPVAITARGLPGDVRAALDALDHVEVVANAPIRDLLVRASVLLMPSQWPEPFGRVAFEGLAAGVPTLASATGGLPDFVPADQLVDPPDSVEAWVRAVRALDDPARRDAARSAGIAAGQAVVQPPPAERLEAILRGAVAARAAPAPA